VGALGSINALGIVLLNLTVGRSRPRLGFFLSQILVAVSVFFLWNGVGAWIAAGYFLAGGFRTARSLLSAMIEEVIPRPQLGLAYGLAETVAGFSLILAPVVAGFLYESRPSTPYPASLGLLAVALVLSWLLAPADRPQPQPRAGTEAA
jgi:MFS family permease